MRVLRLGSRADRWTEAMWRNLEKQVGAPEPLKNEQMAEEEMATAAVAGILWRRPEQRGACFGRAT
jgi:hypothetical protein